MTLIAAFFAWRTVQQQITAQREIAEKQSAVQRFEILSRQANVIEDEIRHSFKLSGFALQSAMIDGLRGEGGERNIMALALLPKYKELLGKLETSHEEWEISSTRSVNFLGAMPMRLEFEDKINSIIRAIGPAIAAMEVVALRVGATFIASDDSLLDSIKFKDMSEAAVAARQKYVQQLVKELQPVYAAIRAAREEAGI